MWGAAGRPGRVWATCVYGRRLRLPAAGPPNPRRRLNRSSLNPARCAGATLAREAYSSSSSSRSSSPSSPRCRLVPPADAAFPFPFPLPDYADDDDALSAGRAGPGQFFWPLRQPDRWQTLSGREAVRFCQGAGGRHNVTDDLPAKLLVLLVLASSASASASACPSACPSRRRPGAACRSRAGRAACWP